MIEDEDNIRDFILNMQHLNPNRMPDDLLRTLAELSGVPLGEDEFEEEFIARLRALLA